MTHLLRLVSHLGWLRGSSSRQLVDYTTSRNKRSQGLDQMGQATSFIRGYADGKDESRDKGLKGLDTDEASLRESEVEQRAVADVLADAEKILEATEVEKKIEKELVPEFKPVQAERVKKGAEEPVRSQTALNLALEELGEPPERPLPGDCCGQGCDVCVWDTYNDELRDYLARKKALLKQSK